MLDLNDLPELAAALQNVAANVTTAIAPKSESGRKVSRKELLHIMSACGHLLVVVAKALES